MRLDLIQLEDRSVPAVFGTPWPDASHLSVSFAPDGTTLGDGTSTLSETLSRHVGEPAWKMELLKALQTWAVHGNINLSVVSDAGREFGRAGPVQGSGVEGDIRFGATPLSPGELAIANPFDWFSGWSGSVLFNSEAEFTRGGSLGTADLFRVALHEAGHVLGVGNNPDPTSVMYTTYDGTGPHALSPTDIAEIHALYGKRRPDVFDAGLGNNTPGRATPIGFSDANGFGDAITADLTAPSDVDYYSVRAPLLGGAFTVAVKTSGISLLTPKVTVYDSRGRVVGSDQSTDPLSGDVSVRVSAGGLLRGLFADYTIKVEKARDDVFGIGSYQLAVGRNVLSPATSGLTSVVNTLTHNLDLVNGTLTALGSATGMGRHWEVSTRSAIDHVGDVDTYGLVTPLLSGDRVMVVTAWGLGEGGVSPDVEVRDLFGRPVGAQVLTRMGGMTTLQLQGVGSLETFTVRIKAGPDGAAVGGYFFGVDYRPEAIALDTFAQGTLSRAGDVIERTLDVGRTENYYLNLSAEARTSARPGPVRMTLADADGAVVSRTEVGVGGVASTNQLLRPGRYTMRLEFVGTAAPVDVRVEGVVRTDPMGPRPFMVEDEPVGPSRTKTTTSQTPPPPREEPADQEPIAPPEDDEPEITDESDPMPEDDPWTSDPFYSPWQSF